MDKCSKKHRLNTNVMFQHMSVFFLNFFICQGTVEVFKAYKRKIHFSYQPIDFLIFFIVQKRSTSPDTVASVLLPFQYHSDLLENLPICFLKKKRPTFVPSLYKSASPSIKDVLTCSR